MNGDKYTGTLGPHFLWQIIRKLRAMVIQHPFLYGLYRQFYIRIRRLCFCAAFRFHRCFIGIQEMPGFIRSANVIDYKSIADAKRCLTTQRARMNRKSVQGTGHDGKGTMSALLRLIQKGIGIAHQISERCG